MPNDKTPLQKIQDETADYLDPYMPAITRAGLDAFLVQAFDAGIRAVDELNAEVKRLDSEPVQLSGRLSVSDPVRYASCTCGGSFDGMKYGTGCTEA